MTVVIDPGTHDQNQGQWSRPGAELVREAVRRIGDPQHRRAFFLELANPHWVEPLRRSQPTVSHHLKVLREAGLVEGERRGTWVWYRIVPEALADLGASVDAPSRQRV